MKHKLLSLFIGMSVLLTAMVPVHAFADENSSGISIENDLKSSAFEGFINNNFEQNMSKYQISGAVISIVRMGKKYFQKDTVMLT